MARIRYLKPEFFEDTKLADLPRDARFLFAGLWCWMDRQGITEADPKIIKKNIFPYDDDLTQKKVISLIDALVEAKRLIRIDWLGKKLLWCPKFEDHQKFHPGEHSRYNIPIDHLQDSCKTPASKLLDTVETPASSTLTGIGIGTLTGTLTIKFDFESIYKKYPRKEGKQLGLAKAKRDIETPEQFAQLEKAIDRFVEHHRRLGTDAPFIPHFSTFMTSWRDWTDPETGSSETFNKTKAFDISDYLTDAERANAS